MNTCIAFSEKNGKNRKNTNKNKRKGSFWFCGKVIAKKEISFLKMRAELKFDKRCLVLGSINQPSQREISLARHLKVLMRKHDG